MNSKPLSTWTSASISRKSTVVPPEYQSHSVYRSQAPLTAEWPSAVDQVQVNFLCTHSEFATELAELANSSLARRREAPQIT
jgi:hypothetical protein